jgi:hypothetical protein
MAFVSITAAVAIVALNLTACGSGTSGDTQSSASEHPRPTKWELLSKSASQEAAEEGKGPVSAKMADVSFAPSTVQEPQNGGWVASTDSGSLSIYVTAGGDAASVPRGAEPEPPPDGFIDIGGYGIGGHKSIVVHGTGAIKLTKAPVGRGLPWSVFHADIQFTSQSGMTGTIHLKDGTITLNR